MKQLSTDGIRFGGTIIVALFIPLFFLSGFSALIYQSMWSKYLALILGHASYAQTLVLMLFMGGMAIGSWIASLYSSRSSAPLVWYAGVEVLLGLFGIAYHWLFESQIIGLLSNLGYFGSPLLTDIAKWVLAGGSILFQTILLGATFPLMAAAMCRGNDKRAGALISTLYFINSLGAAVGAFSGVFILLPWAGMPGAMLTAGLLNILIGLIAWLLNRSMDPLEVARQRAPAPAGSARITEILIAAVVTGAASFVYEIMWIRALSLVFGTTLHSFELMLTAFIAGIAFGGLYIRRRIDNLTNPLAAAGVIQLLMGAAALATVPIFIESFEWVATLIGGLEKNDTGYALYNSMTAIVAIMVMFPASFFAGMTLPLFTVGALRAGGGETAIGRVYAANTFGTILGVLLGFHLLLPLIGLRSAIVAAAAIDIGLGFYLLARFARGWRPGIQQTVGFASLATLIIVAFLTELDPGRASSGTFRYARADQSPGSKVEYYRDGKTATVAVVRYAGGTTTISTNGKPDASLHLGDTTEFTGDEITMVMAGALALMFADNPEITGNIGFGSGMTVHTLLGSPLVKRVDTVEIEPAMVEGARLFDDRVGRAFSDPRSMIILDDAKSYFIASAARYDAIVSEPSNPWVSGVANLFTTEFYGFIEGHIKPGGVLVQWMHTYEMDIALLQTMIAALGEVADDYLVFHSGRGDVFLVSSFDGPVRRPNYSVLENEAVASDLERVGFESPTALMRFLVGDKKLFDPLNKQQHVVANSDYFPVVSLRGPKSRFKLATADELAKFGRAGLPITELLVNKPRGISVETLSDKEPSAEDPTRASYDILSYLRDPSFPLVSSALVNQIKYLQNCNNVSVEQEHWTKNFFYLSARVLADLSPEDAKDFTDRISSCSAKLVGDYAQDLLGLISDVAERDVEGTRRISKAMLEAIANDPGYMPSSFDITQLLYIQDAYLLGSAAQGVPINPELLNLPEDRKWGPPSPLVMFRHRILAAPFRLRT